MAPSDLSHTKHARGMTGPPGMDLQGGWSSGLLLSSWVGPGVLGFQDPLSALPGSFRGPVSSTPSILLMEPGGGGEKWRAVGVPGRGLFQLPWEGLRPSLSHPTWKNEKRTASGSLREQRGKGVCKRRDRGVTARSSIGHATRKLRPKGRGRRAGAKGKALPPLSGDLLARNALPRPTRLRQQEEPQVPKLRASHLLLGDPPLPRGRAASRLGPYHYGGAAGTRGREGPHGGAWTTSRPRAHPRRRRRGRLVGEPGI